MQSSSRSIGISAIAIHQPAWVLENSWFEGLARKFVHHTGIEARPISHDDEITMGVRAVSNLQAEVGCNLRHCMGLVFISPSFVPMTVATRLLPPRLARQERLSKAARELARRLGVPYCLSHGMNWFCSGYAKGLSIAQRMARSLELAGNEFLLVVTAGRISRITDYSCKQTGPLFGDMATATLLAPLQSQKHPVHFELLSAFAEKQPATGAFFDFHLQKDVPLPTENGGKEMADERLVFSLDGMGIADAAPRAMSSAVAKAIQEARISPDEVQFVVPHQAGAGIVRLTAMKLDALGIRGEVINGMVGRIGNVSSSSIPYALKQTWQRLQGVLACPTAAVGSPGKAEVSQGCILLRGTASHQSVTRAA